MISARVIDGIYGCPAHGVQARLDRNVDGAWKEVLLTSCDETGDLSCRLPEAARGIYRLELGTDAYFASLGVSTLLPKATIDIRVSDESALYHFSVLIAPYAHIVSTSLSPAGLPTAG
jgi:5-hydroxyisourate hydrolase-like protein (transthyretin family)